jgi:hypothetical protein
MNVLMNTRRMLVTLIAGIAALVSPLAGSAADVLTQHNDRQRTGANLSEAVLKTSNVNAQHFGKLWTLYADGQITAQPLYVSGLDIDTTNNPNTPKIKGKFNAVVIATMHNTIYVYDADKENKKPDGQTTPLWATWLGKPRPGGEDIDMYHTNTPEWGILSTPVIDDQKKTIYAVAWHDIDGKYEYRLHALNLTDGTARHPAVTISGSITAPNNAQVTFDPRPQKQRAALLLSNGVIYIGFGGGYHGWLFAYDAKTLEQKAVWCTTPTGNQGGVWMAGQGPAADAAGHVYVMTGNGTFNADPARSNYADSFVKLKLENGTFVVKDYFTPCNEKYLEQLDIDLGSAGPLLIPGQSMITGGGKQGRLFLLPLSKMGHHVPNHQDNNCNNPNIPQEIATSPFNSQTPPHIHGSPVFWKGPDTGRVYVWTEHSRLKAYKFENGRYREIQNPKIGSWRPPDGMPGGLLSLSSNGSRPGTGILWALVQLTGNANQYRGVKGVLMAVDAQDVSRTLWRSDQQGDHDQLGLFAKFVPPTIAGGKVFAPTYGDDETQRQYFKADRPQQFPRRYYVAVYGLIPKPVFQIVDQNTEDITIVRANAIEDVTIDLSKCGPIASENVDCTEELERVSQAPSLHTVVVPAGYQFDGCKLLRVTSASKEAGVNNAEAVGFWSMEETDGFQATNSGRVLSKDRLRQTGTATLKSGAPAILHEFVGIANCALGETASRRQFKPFMDFRSPPDKKIFRNWDFANNHMISRDQTEFDRSGDVLKAN